MMKTWIKRSLFGLFGASLLVGGLAACSHGRYEHGPMTEERMTEMRTKLIERASSQLKLNEAQKQKLNLLADALQTQRKAMMGPSTPPRAEMQALVAGDKFDRARAQALLDEKTRAVQTGGPAVIAALGDFFDSLDAEQQKQVRELMQQRHRGWWGHPG